MKINLNYKNEIQEIKNNDKYIIQLTDQIIWKTVDVLFLEIFKRRTEYHLPRWMDEFDYIIFGHHFSHNSLYIASAKFPSLPYKTAFIRK